MSGLFPAGARLLLANGYLATVPLGFQMVVFPLYMTRAGFDPAFIGLLFTISGLVTSALVAVSGVLADRFGRSRFLVAGTALPATSYAILALTTDPAWLVVAAILGGVGLANGAAGALTVSSFDALLAERTSDAERTRVFASAQALWNLALATGAIFAGIPEILRATGVAELDSYRPAFVVSIAVIVIATLLVLPIRDMHRTPDQRPTHWLPRRSVRPIVTYSIGIGLLGFGLGVAVQLMPLWLNLRFGVTEAELGPWYALAQVLSIVSVIVVPWLDRRFGPSRSVLGMQLMSGALLALIVVMPVFTLAVLLFVARSFLTNLSWPFQQSLLMSAVEPSERASGAGIGFSVWGFANALGPGIAGYLLATGILALPLLFGAVAYASAGLVFGIGFGRIRRARLAAELRGPAEAAS
ncbi:MAG TPA: MFS transporter [Longimicrobiales bacterium]|nr:MFS transporter [Longimicrobiales bacterium]